jgi:hypothetical protein
VQGQRVTKVIHYVFSKTKVNILFRPFEQLFIRLAYLSKFYNWVRDSDPATPSFSNKFELYQFLIETENLAEKINYLEFGVASGITFRWWIERNRHPDSQFIGFDSFQGLPESWNAVEKGAFSTQGKVPQISDDRYRFEIGLFQETLLNFIRSHEFRTKQIIHLDADLYSSTLFVLTQIATYLKKDDCIIFDELCSVAHEFRAFLDFIAAYGVQYKILGQVDNYCVIAIKILSV